MVGIVRTLLLLSRSDSGADPRSVVDVRAVLAREIPSLAVSRISLEIDGELFVRGRSEMFWMGIQNLVGNALKYAPTGGVRVTAQREGDSVIVRVADEGPGIPDEEKERVFERFYRSAAAERGGVEGYGLGLPLARAIARGMGGSLRALDNAPHGTVMELRLPALDLQ